AAARGVLVEAAAREAAVTETAVTETAVTGAAATEERGGPDPRAVAAATLLADLGALGVAEARPETWYGVAGVSSAAPLRRPEETVVVSPSKVETVSTCPLRWS